MALVSGTVKLRLSPAVLGVLQLLELSTEILDLIPEWHKQEREELSQQLRFLAKTLPHAIKMDTEK